MLEGLADQVMEWVTGGVDEEDVGVAVRSTWELGGLATALRRAGLQVWELKRDLPKGDGVRIGTMHRMKGLEFRCVAVAGVDDESLPLRKSLTDPAADEIQHRLDLARERCLLYVACTRAREDLWVGWSGTPSRFLGAVLE
jgi:superfamily I DNA/RNA helicase